MSNNDYLNDLRNNLIDSLKILIEHFQDENTDAYEFYPEKIDPLNQSILELLNNFNFETLNNISNQLGFRRLFPLLEMAEKSRELENTIIIKVNTIIDSYEVWRINQDELITISERYKAILRKYSLEGIFRKGIELSDDIALSSIAYNKGGRTIYKYIYDVTIGWLHEDVIRIWFEGIINEINNIRNLSIQQTAHDSDRVFKFKRKNQNITGEPDFIISLEKDEIKISFHLEVQHVSDRSRKKRKNLIQVPSHRISQSQNYGRNYLIVIPYINNRGMMESVCLKQGPLEGNEENQNYIEGEFINPNECTEFILEFIDSLV